MKNIKLLIIMALVFGMCLLMVACDPVGNVGPFHVVYSGNGNTAGEPPVDSNEYQLDEMATVLDNTGELEKDGYIFDGWNTQADGLGTDYSPEDTIEMSIDIILYAKWVDNSSERHARLVQVNLKPITVSPPSYSVNPIMHVEYWEENVKMNGFKMTFGDTGLELPGYIFDETQTLQQGEFYELEDVTYTDLAVGEYTEFEVNSVSNYFKRNVSTTNTLSFGASFHINNFAQPEHSNPDTVESLGTVGGSLINHIAVEDYPVPENTAELTVEVEELELEACGFELFSAEFIFEINRGAIGEEDYINVTYDGNGATEDVPTDTINYFSGATVTVKPQGDMEYAGFIFDSWNTESDGSGTVYNEDDTFIITTDTTLYAQWEELATAEITGVSNKDAEINSSDYNPDNSVILTDSYEYGMIAYIYVAINSSPTISVSDIAEWEIMPSSADVTVEIKKDGAAIGYNDDFEVPQSTAQQVNIAIAIKQNDEYLDAVLIHVRRIP